MATSSNEDLAFGAVPGSDLDPTTVQAMLQNIFAAQQQGGYPKMSAPEMPPMVRMPALPAVQAIAPPRAPIQGFLPPEGPRQMLGAGQIPESSRLTASNAVSGLSGTGSRASSSTESGGSEALRNLLGGGARNAAGGTGGVGAGGGLGTGLLSTLLRQGIGGLRNLFGSSNQPSFDVEWQPDIYRDPTGFGDTTPSELGDFGGPIGIGPNDTPYLGPISDVAPDISQFMTGITPGAENTFGVLMSDAAPDIFGSAGGGDFGGLLEGLGGGGATPDLGSILSFAGDPEAGLAGSFGSDAIGGLLGDAGGGIGSVVPYLGAASGLFNLGTGIASGNPAAIVNPVKDLGMAALNMSGLIPAGAGIPIAAGAAILTNILMDELQDPKGRVSAVQDANYLAGQQLQQGTQVLKQAPSLLQQANGDLSGLSDDQVFNLFNLGRAGMKSYQLAADPRAHQGQRDSGAQYTNFGNATADLLDRNAPLAAEATKKFQDELVRRGWKPADFTVPNSDQPFGEFYGMPGPQRLLQMQPEQVQFEQTAFPFGREGVGQQIPGGTLFLTPEDWAIWGL